MIRFSMKSAMILGAGLCLCAVSVASDPVKEAKPTLESLRAAFAKKPCKTLAIVEPIEIKQVFYYKDGGSLGLELKDAKGTVHRFALDGRAKKSNNLFVGVTYPSETNGKRVDIWAAEEQELYAVLLRWVNNHPQRAALLGGGKLDETKERLWEFSAFFQRMDSRFRQINGLPRQGQ